MSGASTNFEPNACQLLILAILSRAKDGKMMREQLFQAIDDAIELCGDPASAIAGFRAGKIVLGNDAKITRVQ